MTAQIGAEGLDLFGDPLPELLADVAGLHPTAGERVGQSRRASALSLDSTAVDRRLLRTPPNSLTNKRDSIWAASWLESKPSAGYRIVILEFRPVDEGRA
jgi:hypothetical protein